MLFSGGQDSTVCLAWALERFARVETIGFDYGQRHAVELAVRPRIRDGLRGLRPEWAARLGDDHVLKLETLASISETALTRDMQIEMAGSGLPNTFVPGRNLIFLNYAGALAYRRGIRDLVAGMCETDYSGYPDCRNDTIKAVQTALSLGMDRAHDGPHPADAGRQGRNICLGKGDRWLKPYLIWSSRRPIAAISVTGIIATIGAMAAARARHAGCGPKALIASCREVHEH